MQWAWTRVSGLVVLVVALTTALTLAPARVRDNRRDTRPVRGGVQRPGQAESNPDGEEFAELHAAHLPSAALPGRSIAPPGPPQDTPPSHDDVAMATGFFDAGAGADTRRPMLAYVPPPVSSIRRPAAAGRAPPPA